VNIKAKNKIKNLNKNNGFLFVFSCKNLDKKVREKQNFILLERERIIHHHIELKKMKNYYFMYMNNNNCNCYWFSQ
jgi:hypothetical protein